MLVISPCAQISNKWGCLQKGFLLFVKSISELCAFHVFVSWISRVAIDNHRIDVAWIHESTHGEGIP